MRSDMPDKHGDILVTKSQMRVNKMGKQISPINILKQYFGYDSFKENQEKIIESILSGRDAFVLMPTGSGKSLCYQIPAMILSGVGIVISPLIALMEDQVKGLQENGVKAEYLSSTMDFKSANRAQRQAASGHLDLLYVAPERLVTENFTHFLKNVNIALFAIDEAHCVSQWGHDFRPEYLRISEVTQQFPNVSRLALTATADSVTRKDILEKLDLQKAVCFASSFDRPNIHYHVQVKQKDKTQLSQFIKHSHFGESGIVYVRTRKRTEQIATWLKDRGVSALPYHAGLDSQVRVENQKRFQENSVDVIVATIAFGLGINKPDVRFVAHLDLPASMEAYYQETGRAGRDGASADAWMVYSLSDVVAMNKLFELTPGNTDFKWIQRKKLDALLGYCEVTECRRKSLLAYFGESHEGNCRACDNCLQPMETWDGTVVAQKALSCVYRTKERFGAGYLIDVLLGEGNKRIVKFGHDRITTFGVGTELDKKEWHSIFRQLLSAGYLKIDVSRYGGFRLCEKSWPILRNEQQIQFRKDPLAEVKTPTRSIKSKSAVVMASDGDSGLFETLRSLRTKIAKKNSVPPYVVFHDRTLHAMASCLPRSLDEMRDVHGIGEAKLKKYGRQFLDAILAYKDTAVDPGLEPDAFTIGGEVMQQKGDRSGSAKSDILDTPSRCYSTSGLARKYDQPPAKLFTLLQKIDWIQRRNKSLVLTELGKENGGKYMNRGGTIQLCQDKGFWIVWPGDLLEREAFMGFMGDDRTIVSIPSKSIEKRVVCLANSRKYQGCCIAGKEISKSESKKWIRPVSSRKTGELESSEIRLKGGGSPKLLDIITLSTEKYSPHDYQTENYLNDRKTVWIKKGEFPLSGLREICDDVSRIWINGYDSSSGKNDKIPLDLANEKCESSLLLIKPQQLKIILESGLTYKRKIRTSFSYHETPYNFAVTDSFADAYYSGKPEGWYEIEKGDIYLCVSLGEPFEGFCYKLVAGIIGL